LNDYERIAWQGAALIGMILIDKRERAVGLNAIRKIGSPLATRMRSPFQFSFRIDWAGAVDAGMEPVVGAQFGEERSFGEDFRGGGGDEEFVSVKSADDLPVSSE